MSDQKFEQGMTVRREVLGKAHVDRAEANKTDFDADFQHFITETAWGFAWSRPHLDRRTRHLLTIALLAGLGKENELAMHIRATQKYRGHPGRRQRGVSSGGHLCRHPGRKLGLWYCQKSLCRTRYGGRK